MTLYVESSGEGPAVLFIHAGVADSRMWAAQLEEFSATHQVIAFDQRGYGRTPWEPGPFSVREDALSVLDQLGVESAVLVGCSMGGGAALQLAISHPERVHGLVLVGAFPGGWVPEAGWEENPLEEEAEEASAEGHFDRVVEIDLQMWLVGYGRSADEVPQALKDLFIDMDRVPVTTATERWDHLEPFGKQINDHLDDIEAPTLVIVGEHDEKLLIDAAHHLAGRLGDNPAVVMNGTAHLPSLERPVEFNRWLRMFLDELS
jgi:pimeloyl-ACP methyl ester carboxylesterase